ncbi:MAG TPA: kynureninase, partial [Candidatus Polarisedimenticolia bacterium]|nr:kynureninase [Candidatus Polarisedimenticolia bacterium]
MSQPNLNRRRDEFPALAGGIHLLSHSLGPLPRGARAALHEYLDRWEGQIVAEPWSNGWWELPARVGEGVARLIGAAPGTVQVQPSTSVALSVLASCLDFSRGGRRKVVTGAHDFPTSGYIWEEQRRLGAEVIVVPSEDGLRLSTERLLEA